MAIRLANQKRRPKLAEKLVELARQKDDNESEQDEDTDEDIEEITEQGFSQEINGQFRYDQKFRLKNWLKVRKNNLQKKVVK